MILTYFSTNIGEHIAIIRAKRRKNFNKREIRRIFKIGKKCRI